MRDLAELNINEGRGQRVSREPPSASAVAQFEQRFGITIPGELLALLRFSNGGHPELDSYNPSGTEDVNSFSINTFYYLTEDKVSPYSMWEAMSVWRPYIGQQALPFAEDGGGNILFLDLSAEPPAVKVCWHDENFRIGHMASSFEKLIDGLCLNSDYI
jgi:hypothetical protein